MTHFRFAAAGLFALTVAVAPIANVTPAAAAPAGDAAGGSFSVRFPVEFKDEEKLLGDPTASPRTGRLFSGANADGVEFSALEIPLQGPRRPLEDFADAMAARTGTTATDVSRDEKDGLEMLSFTLAEPSQAKHVRMIRSGKSGYALIVQYPAARAAAAAAMRDAFFGSFRIVP